MNQAGRWEQEERRSFQLSTSCFLLLSPTKINMKHNIAFLSLCVMIFSFNGLFAQKFEGLANTPPMGWNSWNTFGTNINEQLVKDIANTFIDKGLKDAGYQYVVLDDGWMAMERDKAGNLVADPVKFPSGMKSLVDYVHSKGLKFGIYNCAGAKTCGGYPGSRGHEYQDALLYASWGVDYLKYDWCNTEKINAESAYTTMRDALYKAGRPVVFSLCEWGDNQPWLWAKNIGQLWRVSGDITNCWDCELSHGSWSSSGVMRIVDMRQDKILRQYSGPNQWNDLDMMEVGNGMTVYEDKSHFALWCMHASPLIMGNDLRSATKETFSILTNKEAIAVNQDALGIEGFKSFAENGLEIWAKPLSNGDWAICFLNRGNGIKNIAFDWKKHERVEDALKHLDMYFNKNTYKIRDLFLHQDIGTTDEVLKKELKEHEILMLRLTKIK
jgi:alpha-galactosidase